MKIASIPASFPVFRVSSRVTYQTPRRPTAIERMLLRLCTEFPPTSDVGRMSVGDIFVDVLCVPDAGILVDPTDTVALAAALRAATAFPHANVTAREAALVHDVNRQAEKIEAVLLGAAAGRPVSRAGRRRPA